MTPDPAALLEGILAGNRGSIARAITLVESTKPAHRALAHELIASLAPYTGKAIRVGISGVPGAGKSTFINAMGLRLAQGCNGTTPGQAANGEAGTAGAPAANAEAGAGATDQPSTPNRIAILAIDPSSTKTGGSILGDRTRMADLAMHDQVFIRPSPSAGHLGGVAKATRQAMLICEAAGYTIIIVETVGVGQSEIAVSQMVDTFLLLHVARTGDQLQGIKRGILELADIIAVTKADGDNAGEARVSARELRTAVALTTPPGDPVPPVLTCSSMTGDGLDDVWAAIIAHRQALIESNSLAARRLAQQRDWLTSLVNEEVLHRLWTNAKVQANYAQVIEGLAAETTTAMDGATSILDSFLHGQPGPEAIS